jgi:hypothetical protein
MNIQITRITPTKYSFKANGYEFFAETNANSGAWNLPAFTKTDFPVLRQNPAQLAHSQVVQFLKKNPLMIRTNKIDGKTNKRIFVRNTVFGV